MAARSDRPSARRITLLELSYEYIQDHGMAELSLRPLAIAVGSSPRVLLFLFGNKDGLIREVLVRARADERRLLARVRGDIEPNGVYAVAELLWSWLSAPERRPQLALWAEAYARSLSRSPGPCDGFGLRTVEEWLTALASAQPASIRGTAEGLAQRTLVLAVLRGALLDLLATDDLDRTTSAVLLHLELLRSVPHRTGGDSVVSGDRAFG